MRSALLPALAAVVVAATGCAPGTPLGPRTDPTPAPASFSLVAHRREPTGCGWWFHEHQEPWPTLATVSSFDCHPGIAAGHTVPPVPLDEFTESGRTGQGLAYWVSEQKVYMCTNSCEFWRDTVVVIEVPAGTAGATERTAVVMAADVRKAPWLEAWARDAVTIVQ